MALVANPIVISLQFFGGSVPFGAVLSANPCTKRIPAAAKDLCHSEGCVPDLAESRVLGHMTLNWTGEIHGRCVTLLPANQFLENLH
jgi:hypothetical protein